MKQGWNIDDPLNCPMAAALNVVAGKWKPMILHMLGEGTLRFGELKRNIPPASQKVLTDQLRELEMDGVVSRTVYAEIPPKVEYSLTEKGRSLKPILDQLLSWGQTHHLRR